MRTIKKAVYLQALLICMCGLSSVPAAAQNWGTAPVWSDEFKGPLGTPIDSTKWTFDTGILNVNDEVEYYCAPSTLVGGCQMTMPNAFIDGNDNLVIRAIKVGTSTAPNSGSWTSARLITKGLESFQFGRVEARMSLPTVAPGIWPAFWALGSNIDTVSWPNCGEVDYMENVPLSGGLGPTKIASSLHQGGTSARIDRSADYTFKAGDVTGMHVYGAIWSPNMVQFYVDDPTNIFYVQTASDIGAGQTWGFNHPFFLLLNLAIGGDGSWPGAFDSTTPNPSIMTVDYVRIYQAAAIPAPTLGNPAGITVTAGAATGNTTTVNLGDTTGSGRVFLSCSTTAPKSTCQILSNDPLNGNTVDFSTTATATATLSIFTTSNAILPPQSFRPGPFRGLRNVAAVLAMVMVLVLLAQLSRKLHRPGFAAGTVLILLAAIFVGCGGGNSTMPPPPGNGTTPGAYTITVNAYTLTGNGTAPDATVSVPLTVK